jgi:hypothetical protein
MMFIPAAGFHIVEIITKAPQPNPGVIQAMRANVLTTKAGYSVLFSEVP